MIDFKVDTEAISNSIVKYQTEIDNINKIKENLNTCIQKLRDEGWNSKAGDKFMNSFDDNWSKNVDKYLLLIEHLKQNLSEAGMEFSKLESEAQKLTIKD